MKIFAVFAAILAVAAGLPAISTWTLNQLSDAVSNPNTDPAVLPYLENALNELLASMFAGNQQGVITVSVPTEDVWTFEELIAAVHNPQTNPAFRPFLENALQDLLAEENLEGSIAVSIPAMEVNIWTMQQLSSAIENPETDPELLVYLEYALNEIMSSIFSGNPMESIVVVTPPGVVAAAPAVVAPSPVIVAPLPVKPPVKPEPVVVPPPPQPAVVPEAAAPETPSSPLVQIIVNVNAQGAAVDDLVAVEKPVAVLPVITEPTVPVAPAPIAVFPFAA